MIKTPPKHILDIVASKGYHINYEHSFNFSPTYIICVDKSSIYFGSVFTLGVDYTPKATVVNGNRQYIVIDNIEHVVDYNGPNYTFLPVTTTVPDPALISRIKEARIYECLF